MNYTKGKGWKAYKDSPNGWYVANGQIVIATLHTKDDACLIAAAPDMYEALKELKEVNSYWWQEVPSDLLDRIDKALAKAKGKDG